VRDQLRPIEGARPTVRPPRPGPPAALTNRISSSGQGCPDRFKLDQSTRSVLRARRRTALNCNPNCNLQIRSSMCGHPDPFRSVRDLGLVPARCSGESGISESRSPRWLPAWLPVSEGLPHRSACRGPSAFRPDISPVGVDRASVMRRHQSLLSAVGCCCCCHRCCQSLVLFPSPRSPRRRDS
jgi:hypothetical protein